MNLDDPIMKTKWAKCINNDDHKVSLTVGDCYIVEASKKNDPVHWIRIIDNTGEAYLFPEKYFEIYWE
ncbi:MAG TPA: hypothetical protein PLX69_12205 [Leptospiraceae bacterium]|nr:hypothetical protein [Leptospiraceae bacterium]HRG75312.1 hypothetical protein [Leptospiraceae bacterium]